MPREKSKVTDSSRYPIEVFYSEGDEGYIAVAKDLPGCSAFGKSQAAAAAEMEDAVKAWLGAAKAAGNPIPEPSRHVESELPSGKLLLRIPRSLHASLIDCAKRESVSLNQHLVCVLSLSVGTSPAIRETQSLVASMQNFVAEEKTRARRRWTSSSSFSLGHIADPGNIVRPAEPLEIKEVWLSRIGQKPYQVSTPVRSDAKTEAHVHVS